MTDNEIIKALEGVTYGGNSCAECKHKVSKGDERCGLKGCNIARNALDLINRQQAEIERFRKILNDTLVAEMTDKQRKEDEGK